MSADEFEAKARYGSDDWIDDFGIPREKRFSRPKLPDPTTGAVKAWTRTSTIAKVLDDTYNLELWKQRMVGKGIASRRDLTNRAATTHIEDRNAWFEICEMAMQHAGSAEGRNNGTALHALVETYNADPANFDASAYPEEMINDLHAYIDALRAYGLINVPGLAERTMVNAKIGIAGTWDAVLESGSWAFPRIGDLKTQKTVDYSQVSIAMQVAGYAYGDVMLPKPWPGWEGTVDDYLPMPTVDLKWGVLIHLPVGKGECHIYDINLEDGFTALKMALSVRRWRSRKDLFIPMAQTTPITDTREPIKATIIPTARHTPKPKPEPKPIAAPVAAPANRSIVTVQLEELVGIAKDPDKLREHIKGAIKLIKSKGTLAAMYNQYKDVWTEEMTDLGKDRLLELAGKKPLGEEPPF